MSASKKENKVPALVDKPMDFCPGCGHGIISRLIMECLDELNQNDNIIFPIGVGCSSNLGAGLECDRLHCSHGRAGAVATGMKRVNPDVLIVSYQGDGDAYNIGIAVHDIYFAGKLYELAGADCQEVYLMEPTEKFWI